MQNVINTPMPAKTVIKGFYGLSFYSECIRIGYYLVAIVISLATQYIHPYFINSKVWMPVYMVIFCALIYHLTSLVFLQEKNFKRLEKFSFFIDACFLALIIYITYYSYPVFTFLFLVNIGLCSVLYGRDTSLVLAGFTSVLYAVCFAKGNPSFSGLESVPFLFNIASFHVVALISGYLGELYLDKDKQLIKTKEDLVQLQSFSDVVVQNVGTGLITLNSENKISYYNQAAAHILPSKVTVGESLPALERYFKKISSKNKATFREEIEIKADDKIKYLEMINTYLPGNDIFESGWIVLLQDLTEVKNLEKELALKEKLAAVGQLAGGIAHEIRNPLASISGSVEMLQQTTKGLSPENDKLFSIIIKEIDRLNNLITEFLSFVRPEVRKADRTKIQDMVEDIFTLIKFNKDMIENVNLEYNFESCEILCDKGKLKQALLNIIVNAFQAVKDAPGAFVRGFGRVEGRFYIIEVSDNGLGIPKEILSKVFEPFYTTKAKGTGLGLAITHRIIEGHSGEIKVSSEVKKGTTFLIKLPID